MLISILTVLSILTVVSSMTVVYPKVVLTVVFILTVAYILSGLHPHSCLHILTVVSSLSDYSPQHGPHLVSRARPFTQSLHWERVWSNSHSKLVLHCQHNCIRCGQLVLIVREVQFNSFLRAVLMIALLNNCLVAKTLRAIFIHPHCLYSNVTATLNQLPVQEIPGPVETKPLWEFDQTLSQRSDWVKGLARETSPHSYFMLFSLVPILQYE